MRIAFRPFAALMMPVLLLSAGPEAAPQLVNLSVVAIDGKGEAVTDLKDGDFEVRDAGQRRDIGFFRDMTRTVAEAPALAAGEVGNRRAGLVHHPTVLLFDLLNASFRERTVIVNRIVQQLTGLESADDFYFYFITPDGHLFPVRGLPGGVTESTRPESAGTGGKPWTADMKTVLDEALKGFSRIRKFDYDTAVRIQLTLNSLQELANRLEVFPGRKNVVWLTDGIPVYVGTPRYIAGEPLEFTAQLKPFAETFGVSGTSIYSVPQTISGNEDFDVLSELTGGLPSGKKDIGATVRQAMADSRTSYQLGFRPVSLDKTYHKLRVTCTRKGIRILSKTGYYAFPEQPGSKAANAIRAAVSAPSDAAGIGLRGSLKLDATGRTGGLAVHIDVGDLAITDEGDRSVGQVRLAIVAVMADGRNVTSPIVPIGFRFTAGERAIAVKEGMPFDQNITLAPGLKALRVAVFDEGSESVGSLTMALPERP